ncbi:hypothetical protein EJB05_09135, partial [Eragrostis curvula]
MNLARGAEGTAGSKQSTPRTRGANAASLSSAPPPGTVATCYTIRAAPTDYSLFVAFLLLCHSRCVLGRLTATPLQIPDHDRRLHSAEQSVRALTYFSSLLLLQFQFMLSPRDASRCAAVSPAFRAAADSDHVWRRFIPDDLRPASKRSGSDKEAYLALCDDATNAAGDDEAGGGCRVWLEKASGAKCYALSARRLSLPWDDGEFSWRWTTHPSSRFGEVAELFHCTCLDIYAQLPTAALTQATTYAAYLVYGTAEESRGLSYPDQETVVTVGGREVARHAVCLRPDDAEARKFRGGGAAAPGGEAPRRPRVRDDGWWEMEMGRLCTASAAAGDKDEEEVVASFEVLGWYPKRGLIVEGVEFRPLLPANS